MLNPKRFDAHIHVETDEATPFTVLEKVREKGLIAGLVDHVFLDRHRITDDAVKTRCRELFPDVTFLHGAEADACTGGRVALTEPHRKRMDFVIVSFTHLGQPGTLEDIDATCNESLAARIMELLDTALGYPHTDVLGHPFSFDLDGIDSWQVVQRIEPDRIAHALRVVRERGILVEINARTLRNMDPRPQEYFLDLANREGCSFTVSSDAHYLEEVGRRDEAWALVEALGIPIERIGFPKLPRR